MNEFMKAYTIKEVSKTIDVPEGTIRQWEKDFPEVLIIPRDRQNARYFTDFEIEILSSIKTMRDKNLSKKMINDLLQKRVDSEGSNPPSIIEPSVPALKQSEALETLRNVQKALETFPEIKEILVSEIKNEIRNELTDAVRNEISSSLEQGNSNTSEQLKALSESLNSMEENYEREVNRRDKILMENLSLMKEIKEQRNKSFLKKLFGK